MKWVQKFWFSKWSVKQGLKNVHIDCQHQVKPFFKESVQALVPIKKIRFGTDFIKKIKNTQPKIILLTVTLVTVYYNQYIGMHLYGNFIRYR